MAQKILEIKDLHYNYPDGTQAINGIDFEVEEGQMISILGPNGAGKSTFFLHFNGIIEPTSGEIYIEGKKLEYDKKSLLEARECNYTKLRAPQGKVQGEVAETGEDPVSLLFGIKVRTGA